MRRPTRRELGVVLILLGIGSVVLSLGVSAALAPDITQTDTAPTPTDTTERAPTSPGESAATQTAETDDAERTAGTDEASGTDGGTSGGAPSPNQERRGQTLIGVQGITQALILDRGGNTVWSYGDALGYFDVDLLDNGNVLAATVLEDQQECGPYESPCARTGVRIIDPGTSKVVYEWTYPVRTSQDSEVHDADLLPSGEFLIADMENERVFTMARNGTVMWQWNASTRYDAPEDPTQVDWLHINDVDRIGPGRYMVSVRNANQILIIERGKGVVEVINEDGDKSVLNAQHNPQYLGPGAVLVSDSENNRVVELHKRNGEWKIAWSVGSAGGINFEWPRDADRLPNGNTLITDTRRNRVVEVNRAGDVVWSVEVPGFVYEADRLPGGEYPPAITDRWADSGGGNATGANATNGSAGRDANASGGGATNASLDGSAGSGSAGSNPTAAGPLTAGGPSSSGSDGDVLPEPQRTDLPVFSTAYAGLTTVTSVPYWFRPWHLLVMTVALVMVVVGAVLVWSAPPRRRGYPR